MFIVIFVLAFVFAVNVYALNTFYNNYGSYDNHGGYDNKIPYDNHGGYDNHIPYKSFFNDHAPKAEKIFVQKGDVQAEIEVNQKEQKVEQKKGYGE